MVKISDKDGVVILEGDEIALKVDKSRKIYVKKIDNDTFSYIGHEIQLGLTLEEKKKYLYDLYRTILSKSKE